MIPTFSSCFPGSHRFLLQFEIECPTFGEMWDDRRSGGGMRNDKILMAGCGIKLIFWRERDFLILIGGTDAG